MDQFRLQAILFGFAVSIFSLSEAPILVAQLPAVNNPDDRQTTQKNEDPYFIRWKTFLDSVAQEARTAFPEERRPYAMVEAANAYWEVDREATRTVYLSALDAAISLSKQDKRYRPLINYVLTAATKRDATLAKELNKRLLDDKDVKDRDNISSEAALDLLEENPAAAEQIAEAFAPNGLRDGTAEFLIFSLAKKNIKLSDRLYSVYLGKVIQDESITIEQILPLAGYAFGYSEYYAVDRSGQLSGASFPPIPDLSAKPAIISNFLSLASRRLSKAIERRNDAPGLERAGLDYPILFASQYLLPEVARFSPNTLNAWQQLQGQGIIGTSVQEVQQTDKSMQQIALARLRTQEFSDPSNTPEQRAEASLENVEKLTGTCQRDVVYSKAALTFGSHSNPKRALAIVEKIEDMTQSDSVKEMIFISVAESAIEKDDFGEAQKYAEKIKSPEQKAALSVKLLQELIKKTEYQQSNRVLGETITLVEKLPNVKDRTGLYFSLSTTLLKMYPVEAEKILRDAIKNLNKQEPTDQMSFSIPIKVPLSCAGQPESWYGGFRTPPNSNVIDAVVLFAKQDPEEAIKFADEIGDKITKIRIQAMISAVALAKLQTTPRELPRKKSASMK